MMQFLLLNPVWLSMVYHSTVVLYKGRTSGAHQVHAFDVMAATTLMKTPSSVPSVH